MVQWWTEASGHLSEADPAGGAPSAIHQLSVNVKKGTLMWTMSGFADEIDPDLETQCTILDQLGIKYIEFRSAWDTNVLDLDDDPDRGGRRDPCRAQLDCLIHRITDRQDQH